VLVVAPYAVSVPLAFVAAERLEPATGAGLVALVLGPAALLAPALVNAIGGRRADMAGALVLGTLILSFLLVVTRPASSTHALTAAQAFVVASLAAGAMPRVRDRILLPLRWVGYGTALAAVALAVAGAPPIGASTVIVALVAVAVTLGAAGATALALRRDVMSAVAGSGTRDPFVAIAIAWVTGGSNATAVPLVSAAILGIVAAALIVGRR
jgi:hypothetical protein